jgi:hypothetical protein
MAEQIANNAASVLNGGITNVSGTIFVANGTPFPASGNFRALIDSELVLVGARSGGTMTALTRGVETTTAASHSNGAPITHVITTASLTNYIAEHSLSQTIADAKGDIIAATGADVLVRKAAGADKTFLQADSSQSDGLAWTGAWTAYTPAWTSTGTAPAIGNGTIVGRWQQIGKTVHYTATVTMGSTTTFGTGNYFISLPVTAHASALGFGFARAIDTGTLQYPGVAVLQSTTLILPITPAGAPWTNLVPFTFGNGDQMIFSGTYEAA